MMSGNSSSNNAGPSVTSNPLGSPFDNILSGNDWNVGNGNSNGMNSLSSATPSQDPLSNLMDSVNSLDPLNSMGKSLNEQVNILERNKW